MHVLVNAVGTDILLRACLAHTMDQIEIFNISFHQI